MMVQLIALVLAGQAFGGTSPVLKSDGTSLATTVCISAGCSIFAAAIVGWFVMKRCQNLEASIGAVECTANEAQKAVNDLSNVTDESLYHIYLHFEQVVKEMPKVGELIEQSFLRLTKCEYKSAILAYDAWKEEKDEKEKRNKDLAYLNAFNQLHPELRRLMQDFTKAVGSDAVEAAKAALEEKACVLMEMADVQAYNFLLRLKKIRSTT